MLRSNDGIGWTEFTGCWLLQPYCGRCVTAAVPGLTFRAYLGITMVAMVLSSKQQAVRNHIFLL